MGSKYGWIIIIIGEEKLIMISVLIACREVDDYLIRAINSVSALQPQIIVDISFKSDEALGVRKNRLIRQAAHEWVLVLDTDEVVSVELIEQIKKVIKDSCDDVHGYEIAYRNYIFNKLVHHGGERYSRAQFFHKSFGSFTPIPLHEHPIIKGNIDKLKGVIHHYSYVSLPQVLKKFTRYAWQMAGEKKKAHEQVTLKKLFMYGPHMVWARAIKDQGWRDGWRGIVIALCFGYMETLTYWLLLWRNIIG